jgi:hypothetical protein
MARRDHLASLLVSSLACDFQCGSSILNAPITKSLDQSIGSVV